VGTEVDDLIRKELENIENNYHFGEATQSIEKFAEYVKIRKPEHDWQKFYRLQPSDTFVEAGAFWGTWGIKASELVGENGKVVLIEPSSQSFRILQAVCEHFKLKNTVLVNKAVWNYTKKLKFDVNGRPSDNFLSSSGTEEVEADTLDNILSGLGIETVHLLAADVEGAEVEMMGGCWQYLKDKKIKNVAIGAYHRKSYYESIGIWLVMHGFVDLKWDTTEQGILFGHLRE
jgi:FkbM family methyltransferase